MGGTQGGRVVQTVTGIKDLAAGTLQLFDARDLVGRLQRGARLCDAECGGHTADRFFSIARQYFEVETGTAQGDDGGWRICAHGIGQPETDQIAAGHRKTHFTELMIGCRPVAAGYLGHPVTPTKPYLLCFPHGFQAKACVFCPM